MTHSHKARQTADPITQTPPNTDSEILAALPNVTVPRSANISIAKLMAPPATKYSCLACKSIYNYEIAHWERMPLSILGLPRSEREALDTPDYEMNVRQCASCSHVFHTEFRYEHVPYRDGSNMVFNESILWREYQDDLAKEWARDYGIHDTCVVEIGCGEGRFLERFQAFGNRCIGFEPGPDSKLVIDRGIECFAEYFHGRRLFDLQPEAILCRHVLEHLDAPVDFLEDIAIACREAGMQPVVLAEVPLIEKAIEQRRLNDFQYEHVSYFTQLSLRTAFERAGFEVLDVRPRFNEEVVTIAARPKIGATLEQIRNGALAFKNGVDSQIVNVQTTLKSWRDAGKKTALWGGTGRGTALINMFRITRDVVDIVIDSDLRKSGGFVPGTGQKIQPPSFLDTNPVDRIVICTNWRARDIEREIREDCGLDADLFVYIEGKLRRLTDSSPL